MTESSDQSNPHQSAPRKQKNSIKNIFHNFFKPGIETQLQIKNMVLTDIPTQTTPVFIHIRQGRERIDTQTVKIIDNTATWPDEIIIDSRVPSIDTQQQQRPQNNTSNNPTNSSTPQPSISLPNRPRSMSNLHEYDNYDNYDNYEYEQLDENDSATPMINQEQQITPEPLSTSSSKNQDKSEKSERSERSERSEKRKERKERRELERREKKEKKEKEKREKKENKEKEKKEKKERKPQNSSSSSFCLEFTFRLEDVSGRSSTIYGKTVLDLTQITTANDWEYRAVLHECNYDSIFSCLISVDMKKRKSSAMVESLPPLPTSNNSSNGSLNSGNKSTTQTNSLFPPAKMPSSLNSKFDQSMIYRNRIDRSYSDRPVRRISMHESASLDGINNIVNNNYIARNGILVENTDSELNDNIYIDDNNNNSEQIPLASSKHTKLSSSMKNTNIEGTAGNKKSSSSSKSHSHTRSSHGHRKNDVTIKSAASTIIIPLDQNGNDDEFEEKLPFKVQKDRLERLSDQVDDIINNAFYGFSEE